MTNIDIRQNLPEDFPEVWTICGSSRFKQEIIDAVKKLTLEGKIVISLGLFGHADKEAITHEIKATLDLLHFRKIDLSDGIYVVDVDGYVGWSTENEILYARITGKRTRYHSREAELKS